ncbi:hypothetical protein GJAV_G00128890 [Gymnothorax javanicus]|nr:hypothetical protein GJAV_G00128890 [Gymnothorax javanicus]
MDHEVEWSLALEGDLVEMDSSESSPLEHHEHHRSLQSDLLPMFLTPEEDPFDVAIPSQDTDSKQLREQCAQTDTWTSEVAVNTEEDWDSLMWQRDTDIRKQQALIDKMESLRVKLKLNCSKITRKNFILKVQELTKGKESLEEERNRLSLDLEETEKRLTALMEEQCQEKLTWERELAELRKEAEGARKEAEEACQSALKDEVLALEMQRDVTISQMEEWIAEAERYRQTLRFDTSPQNLQHRLDWDKSVNTGHVFLGNLQRQFNEQLLCLQRGQPLDSLPTVSLPPLPQVPTLELVLGPMTPPPCPFVSMQTAPRLPPAPLSTYRQPHPPSTETPARATPEAVTPVSQCSLSSLPATATSNPAQPTGKLDKLLDKLGARFPACSRSTLIQVLQQIKTSRSGTIAGLSMEELSQQVAQRLTLMQQLHLGPVRPPSGARNFSDFAEQLQRTPYPSEGPAVAEVYQTQLPQAVTSSLKMCLVCQSQVETGSEHDVGCSHVVHKKCISVWLQSTKNNSCPFCPSK